MTSEVDLLLIYITAIRVFNDIKAVEIGKMIKYELMETKLKVREAEIRREQAEMFCTL